MNRIRNRTVRVAWSLNWIWGFMGSNPNRSHLEKQLNTKGLLFLVLFSLFWAYVYILKEGVKVFHRLALSYHIKTLNRIFCAVFYACCRVEILFSNRNWHVGCGRLLIWFSAITGKLCKELLTPVYIVS